MNPSERGATLTELLAVSALLALALLALVPMLHTGRYAMDTADKRTEMTHSARRALDKIVREMRAAQFFEVITPTRLQFVMARGDGTDAAPTVEYQLDGSTGNLEYRARTETGFNYRRRIIIIAPSAVPADYSVSVTFNHAALVSAGKSRSDGNDVRIRYWNGTTWVDLDRFNFNYTTTPTAWNTASTRVWFRLQAAIPAGGTDGNYYLHYGDLGAGAPPENGDNVFLDYDSGSNTAGWTRRNAGCRGTYSGTPYGFTFSATRDTSCYRQFTRPVTHDNVEILWEFQTDGPALEATDRHRVGVSARRSTPATGYMVVAGDDLNETLRIREATSWTVDGGAGTSLASVSHTNSLGVRYFGRFYLVGTTGLFLKAKVWRADATEPLGWMVEATDATPVASGSLYGIVNGWSASGGSPINHRHRHLIVRLRVADPEPFTRLAPEESPSALPAFQPLAGPFRSMSVECFNTSGDSIPCPSATGSDGVAVRSVLITLRAMDPSGEVPDVLVTARAYRQIP